MDDVARGRSAYAEGRWEDAYRLLAGSDAREALGSDDLETLASCAALTGRDERYLALLERLYQTHSDANRSAEAGRAAFWIGFRLVAMGEMGRAGGWLARAQRAVEAQDRQCATRGWLMLPAIHRHLMSGDNTAARDAAAEAAEIGEHCGDRELVAFARNMEGRALMRAGEVDAGVALIDEVMVSVAGGELGPLVTGLVYCSVIASCHQVYALDRAREWTAALAEWCDAQPQLVTFTGSCLVHRAEILQLGGAWQEAEQEAQRAAERVRDALDKETAGDACYQRGEILRLRGELAAAEEEYRAASRFGREPLPGLALLRVAQGRPEVALAALQRVLSGATAPFARARFLPAQVEAALAAGDRTLARAAADELSQIADLFGTTVLDAMAAQAEGAVSLAEGDAQAALPPLRRAFRIWQRVGAPYPAARVRVLAGQACGALGDEEGQRLELDAAREAFRELGAAPDLARLDTLAGRGDPGPATHGLTPRELEVLRLIAAGMTNKGIAEQLHVSERTVDRHVSNIFHKIEVSSRAAATAFAYEHDLVSRA